MVGQSLFFAFESAVPLTWAARLLWLERKAQRAKPRPIPIWRTKKLGLYLLVVSVYQFLYLAVFYFRFTLLDGLLGKTDFSRFDEATREFGHIKGPADDLVFKLLVALDPRLGLDLLRGLADEVLGLEAGLELRLLEISFLLGLAFAIFLLRGRQPLKTYLMFETFFGGPNVLLLVWAGFLTPTLPVWQWFVLTAVFISVLVFISVVPCIWTARLLWSGRQQHRANIEVGISPLRQPRPSPDNFALPAVQLDCYIATTQTSWGFN
jgi:hypothetical protein